MLPAILPLPSCDFPPLTLPLPRNEADEDEEDAVSEEMAEAEATDIKLTSVLMRELEYQLNATELSVDDDNNI